MLLHAIQDATIWLTHVNVLHANLVHANVLHASLVTDTVQSFHFDWSTDHVFLAQIRQTDLMGDIQKAFDNFVKTGQAWAFLIGLVLGYMLKAFTTFG